jgi:glucosamine--fructose-6-phosphate aminotransferase (isomerizing)
MKIIKRWYTKTSDVLRQWKICIGVDIQTAPACSIVIFPLFKSTFCCGFAGILAVKKGEKPKDAAYGQEFIRLFQEIKKRGMKSLLSGLITASDYLNDGGQQKELGKTILQQKRDIPTQRIFFNQDEASQLCAIKEEMKAFMTEEEKMLEENAGHFSTADMEIINSRLILMKDVIWSLEKDILGNVEKIASLTGLDDISQLRPEAYRKYKNINFLMNCLDRLEVRGRDSAGLQISFTFPDKAAFEKIQGALQDKGLHDDFSKRIRAGDLINGSMYLCPQISPKSNSMTMSFVYKTSSIIGELGQNVRELRKDVSQDRILREFSGLNTEFETFITHTRWASVGSITDENCHPVNNFTINKDIASYGIAWPEMIKNYPSYGKGTWFISVVLNGDIDNYQALRNDIESGGNFIAPDITTDTKIIPLQIEKYLLAGHDLTEAFRLAVNDFEGSHAIAMVSNTEPGKVFLALKGSGQSIYVGISPDHYSFSSELYGIVEGTPYFIKMDGEKPSPAGSPETAGQIFVLDQNSQGSVSGIKAFFYDGASLHVDEGSIQKAEITTRDIDRGNYPHYFMKEISESTLSVKKTLRGKYRIYKDGNGKDAVTFNIGQDIIPDSAKEAFIHGTLRNIVVIGHGTAAVAGMAIADGLARSLKGADIRVEMKVASELSGFFLKDDLRDTLVIPITQSGTTTDTNRAVAMAAERGATVIAIVNRRQSDITTKADGVFYTSDGRDIEMSVASTKAFYSQIIAGHVLALYLAQLLHTLSDNSIAEELLNLEKVPDMMMRVIEKRGHIKRSVDKMARQRNYWAVVGSGPNKAAADEIRIKLSELCYKTISSDIIENKKHIDLSAEPLIIVCAAGNPETVTGDVVKDVAIFKAHKAGVVVFADEGEDRFNGIADAVIEIPRSRMPLPVILNTLAGHLWGYYAACRIDGDAQFFREFKNKLNLKMVEERKRHHSFYEMIADREFRRMIRDFSATFNERRNGGDFSVTSIKTISDLTLLLKYAVGKLPLEDFWQDFKEEDEMLSPIDLMDVTLGHAVDELSRPIDAIRHQAKTVTVGTSRKEHLPEGIIFDFLKTLNISTKSLTSNNIIAIRGLQKAVRDIRGYTLYRVANLDADGTPADTTTIAIEKRGGISLAMRSRVETSAILMGTKKTIVRTGQLYVGQGKSDEAPIVVIPVLSKKTGIESLVLIHVAFNENLSLREKIDILGDRFNDIRNLINEYNLPWDDVYLEDIPMETLIGEAVEIIAGRIKRGLDPRSQSPDA